MPSARPWPKEASAPSIKSRTIGSALPTTIVQVRFGGESVSAGAMLAVGTAPRGQTPLALGIRFALLNKRAIAAIAARDAERVEQAERERLTRANAVDGELGLRVVGSNPAGPLSPPFRSAARETETPGGMYAALRLND